MAQRFNPAPGWPTPPAGWTPPPGWVPDPAWPPAPEGWQLWVDQAQPAWSAGTGYGSVGGLPLPVKQRPWIVRHGFLTAVLAIIVIAIAVGSNSGTSTPAAPDSGTSGTSGNSGGSSAVAGTATLLDVTGNGQKSTQKFTAGGDWDINYTYDCSKFGGTGNFMVYIYGEDNSPSLGNEGINLLGAGGTDVNHEHHGGTYYLSVNSECTWHITVTG